MSQQSPPSLPFERSEKASNGLWDGSVRKALVHSVRTRVSNPSTFEKCKAKHCEVDIGDSLGLDSQGS